MQPTILDPPSWPPADDHEVVERLRGEELSADNVVVLAAAESKDTLAFARSVVDGLRARPRRLDCQYLYDARGSALFEQICAQPEYYPTRTEAAILARYAPEIARLTGPVTLVELGSGSSTKTGHILDAYTALGDTAHYVPVDVSRSALEAAAETLTADHPSIQITAINGTYEVAFPLLAYTGPALVLFLGSTIGNFPQPAAHEFWRNIAKHLTPEDYVLLGADLQKDRAVLEAAYNDEAGVTAAFTTNVFARMNRELGAEIDTDAVQHIARYNAERGRIEISARFLRDQHIDVAPLDTGFRIPAGEEILVEISRKFRLDTLQAELASAGFSTRRVFTDERNWFALLLLQKAAS